jgi:uncharacterized protein YdbL (DUF1318 family)
MGCDMKKTPVRLAVVTWIVLVLFSCITVNIYFPEAAVQKTAEEIVDEIRGEKVNKKEEKKGEIREDVAVSSSTPFSLVPGLYAQQETTVSSPKIRALKESLKTRFPELVPFFNQGRLGEKLDGYLDIRSEEGLTLQQRAQLRRLAKDEDTDRSELYAEVASALGIDAGQIDRIARIFGQNWIAKARPGWWIQNEDGSWSRKPE